MAKNKAHGFTTEWIGFQRCAVCKPTYHTRRRFDFGRQIICSKALLLRWSAQPLCIGTLWKHLDCTHRSRIIIIIIINSYPPSALRCYSHSLAPCLRLAPDRFIRTKNRKLKAGACVCVFLNQPSNVFVSNEKKFLYKPQGVGSSMQIKINKIIYVSLNLN